ncbi:MAG: hydantoinase/oxoprolinase family protein, partial [Chloroflexi bacterium]|nr:hydantoinase/oxoprolinase family protein [Chloroflexota bacterium]
TKGFEEVSLMMRGAFGRMAGLSDDEIKRYVTVDKPTPIVSRLLIKGVSERIDCQGNVIVPIDLDEAREALRYLVENQQVEALVVSFLFSYVNPVHERAMREVFLETYGRHSVYFSLSHELVPVMREYARTSTVIINAFGSKTASKYASSLRERLGASGFKGRLLYMQGNGGTTMEEELAPVGMVQSGPAGGAVASKYMADLLGHRHVISTDSGGTSFDVSILKDATWRYSREPVIERFPCIWPLIDIQSIGSGGGTMAHVDPLTRGIAVGPKSAGADPGPVCYDRGGTQPTIVDADLILGLLNPDYFLGGRVKLDRQKAEQAIKEKFAHALHMEAAEVAAGIYDIANAHMSDLIRKLMMPLGLVPQDYVLYAFGGTGPVHAAAYASELGIPRVYIFPTSAVFSALGVAIADRIVSHVASFRCTLPANPEVLNAAITPMREKLYSAMERQGVEREEVAFRHIFYMRYRKQLNELAVDIPVKMQYKDKDISDIVDIFDLRYEETYGVGAAYKESGRELISIQIDAINRTAKPKVREYPEGDSNPARALKGERQACFGGGHTEFINTAIYDYDRLAPGNIVQGPAIIESPITTVVIPAGKEAKVDKYLNIEMTLQTHNRQELGDTT